MSGVTLLTPGQCGEDDCYPCEDGTCCDQGPATSVTISGGTGCWAALNGTWALTASGCIASFSEFYSSPVDPCGTGYCNSFSHLGRTLYFHIGGVAIGVTPNTFSQAITVLATVGLIVYDTVTDPPCDFAPDVPIEYQQLAIVFSRETCRSGSLSADSDELESFGDPPTSCTIGFD